MAPVVVKLLRRNRPYVTEQGARDRVREAALRPAAYGPPRRLRPDVRVDVVTDGGWPVYSITPTAPRTPVGGVVYVHGGGWVNQISSPQWRLAADVAAGTGAVVTVPVYPLLPHGSARVVRDRVAGIVRERTGRYGPTALLGDSAGGQIALSTALHLRDEGLRVPVTTLVSPALDLTFANPGIPRVQPRDPWLGVPGTRALAAAWSGDLPVTDPAVSPLFGDLGGLGPVVVFTGTRDILNPDARELDRRLRAVGGDVEFHEAPGQLHVYPLLPTAPGRAAARVLVEGIGRRLRPAP
nr:alpha/beta hydrolase fold domain-containing protein [Kineococcus aurantiacus]